MSKNQAHTNVRPKASLSEGVTQSAPLALSHVDTILAMTDTERSNALCYIAGYSPEANDGWRVKFVSVPFVEES
jgi:hypothetical protein